MRAAGAWSTGMNSSIKMSGSHRLSVAMLSFLMSPYASGLRPVDTLYKVIFSHRNDVISSSCASTSRTTDRVKERLMWVGCLEHDWTETFLSNDRLYSHAGQSPSDQQSASFHLKQQVEKKANSSPLSSFHCPLLGASLESQWWYWHEKTIGHTLSPTSNYLLN